MTAKTKQHDMTYIAESLRPLAIPINAVSEDPSNTRIHSDRNIEVIAGSLRAFGQQKPIVVDKDNVCRAGNGTLRAARRLGWSHIAASRTALTGSKAVAFGIADNRSGDPEIGSIWDSGALAEHLEALRAEPDLDELLTGFSGDEINGLIMPPGGIGAVAVQGERQAGGDVLTQCPKCGFEWKP